MLTTRLVDRSSGGLLRFLGLKDLVYGLNRPMWLMARLILEPSSPA
jgi:hypothetical protein